MEASELKRVNSILDVFGVNTLSLVGLHIKTHIKSPHYAGRLTHPSLTVNY